MHKVQHNILSARIKVDEAYTEVLIGKPTMKKYRTVWLPFAIDLCDVSAIQQATPEDTQHTTLYDHAGTSMGILDVPYDQILPHFIASRNQP